MRGLAPASIARILSAWRAYYRWLGRHGAVASNPCEGLRAPRRARALPKSLSVDQANALLEGRAETALDLRDKAMFELLSSSGLRLSELAGLDVRGGLGTSGSARRR